MKRAARAPAAAVVLALGTSSAVANVKPAASNATERPAKRIGSVAFYTDTTYAQQGGVIVVRLRGGRLGAAWALFDGRRAPFYPNGGSLRALVGVPVTAAPGAYKVGVEIASRRGRQRIPLDVAISPRGFPPLPLPLANTSHLPFDQDAARRDGRRLLATLRIESPALRATGPFQPPLDAAAATTYGSPRYGGRPIDSLMDGVYGEYHRGLDYIVPAGTPIAAPGAGDVVLAAHLSLSGLTVVLDHGQGVVSVLCHLGRIDVGERDAVPAAGVIGVSGDTGFAATPHLHWGTYLHGVAVDPQVLLALLR